ncbi:MAG: hypothetical protein ACJ763_09265 [Bdellovibrionia bacterium]
MPIESHMTGLFKRAVFGFGFLAVSASVSAWAAGSGSLRLSGQVDPQLNVTTSLDWSNWVLRLDNASNVENDTYWIDLGGTERVRLDRTAVVDLASWMARTRVLPGKRFQVTIASP